MSTTLNTYEEFVVNVPRAYLDNDLEVEFSPSEHFSSKFPLESVSYRNVSQLSLWSKKKKVVLGLVAAVVISFATYFFMVAVPWGIWIGDFLNWVHSLGKWGNIVLILAFIVISFPFTFGYIPLSLGAGYLYGLFWGTITSMIGSVLGAFLCFILFRKIFSRIACCTQMLESKPESGDQSNGGLSMMGGAWGNEGPSFTMAMLLRLMPFPFGFSNAFFAMTRIKWQRYVLSTWIGLTPFQIMWVYLGTTLRSLTEAAQGNIEGSPGQMISLVIQLGAGVAVPLYLCYYFKKKASSLKTLDADGGAPSPYKKQDPPSKAVSDDSTVAVINHHRRASSQELSLSYPEERTKYNITGSNDV